jgi:hypothetical protein
MESVLPIRERSAVDSQRLFQFFLFSLSAKQLRQIRDLYDGVMTAGCYGYWAYAP